MGGIDIAIGGKEKGALTHEIWKKLNWSIERLEISVRTKNRLTNDYDVRIIVDLVTKGENEIHAPKSLKEAKEALTSVGLALDTKFYDHSSGRELPREEAVAAIKSDETRLGFEREAYHKQSGLPSEFIQELENLFPLAGHEVVSFPPPPEVFQLAAQRLHNLNVILRSQLP
jgi:hypothetical protein